MAGIVSYLGIEDVLKEGSKQSLLSFYLPALVYVSLSRLIFFPVFFPTEGRLGFLSRSDSVELLAFVGLATVFLGYTLMSVSAQLVRLFEGYYLRRFLRPLEWLHKKRRRQMFDEANAFRHRYETEDDEDLRWYLEYQFIAKEAKFETFYPLEEDGVMPTAIGNVFRAFEQYPGRRYGIDAVLFWPHLTSVLPPRFASRVEEAKSSLMFLLTSCLMCSWLVIEALTAIILDPSGQTSYAMFAVCACAAALAFQRSALEVSISLGELMKSCFDLFRHDLLRKFGVPVPPGNEAAAWARLRRFMLVDRSAWLSEWVVEIGEAATVLEE
jgi:hypothetical protein